MVTKNRKNTKKAKTTLKGARPVLSRLPQKALLKKKKSGRGGGVTGRWAVKKVISREARPPFLAKAPQNPIIAPRKDTPWESLQTFNPAALSKNDRVHILYRAIGHGGLSVLGYASSGDGIYFDERHANPVYVAPSERDHKISSAPVSAALHYSSGGGGAGGCEDPRLTVIDDVVYLMYTAFDGWGSVRIALASISLDDFLAKRWNWKKPVLISPPGEIHKNWVLFPEKVHGKYAFLHSITPTVQIEYVTNLKGFDGEKRFIQSHWKQELRKKVWDSYIRGAGSPPIKTKYGWLLFYHATDVRESHLYKMGAMLLDLNDPTKIVCRAKRPVLEPEEYYEHEGFKGGIVYTCGAVVVNDHLFVYYGGADTVVCVATAPLEDFLKKLLQHKDPSLKRVDR